MSIDKTEDSKYGVSSKATFVLIIIWNIWFCGGEGIFKNILK
jgi:hypothetical protein